MSTLSRLRKAVKAALTIADALEAHGYESRSGRGVRRFNDCPSCGEGTSGKLVAWAERFYCHSCGASGDVLDVLGLIHDLDPRRDFAKVLEIGASLAGLSGDFDQAEFEQKREQRRLRQAEDARRKAQQRQRAEKGAAETYRDLPAKSRFGREYLISRHVDPDGAGLECCYTPESVCLPLWRDDQIVNLVGRRFDGATPKISGLIGCGTLGTFGRPLWGPRHSGPVVMVEGFFDYLSARQLSPNRLVLGAHGCNNLPYVAEVAAKLINGSDTGLVLVPHRDRAGIQAMNDALKKAVECGIPRASIVIYQLAEGCNDLNDELCERARREA